MSVATMPASTPVSSTASLTIAAGPGPLVVSPLDPVTIAVTPGHRLSVKDAAGREYVRVESKGVVTFAAGGTAGTHTAEAIDPSGQSAGVATFTLAARTLIDDAGGRFADLLGMLDQTMRCYHPSGSGSVPYKGKDYPNFVHWILDHCHTAKGMQFFSPHTGGLIDLLKQIQRPDGMIWSNVQPDPGPGYYDSAYEPYGYAERTEGLLKVRQPVENHNEYNYVETVYMAWKGGEGDAWLTETIPSAIKALTYTRQSPVRWSSRFKLLKRGYTIDSWDFQVHDKYTVEFPLATSQNIDPERTKFGVFHGDNHGYALACRMLAEMLEHLGRLEEANEWARTAGEIHERLNAIAWNGRFYTHRIEEDPTVKRDLGVDESSQIAMCNCYALNRDISHEQAVAILKTYQHLRDHLPSGSPGEWYAIYPPFERGFGTDNGKWQYMNAGVHGHAAGELVRGAYEHGYEAYGSDMLLRLRDLAKKTGNRLLFAYTGAVEPAPTRQMFTPIELSKAATMDLWDAETGQGTLPWMDGRNGNDMRNLPVGKQTLAGVPFVIADPAKNARKSAVAVAAKAPFDREADVPVNAAAGAVYLVHTANSIGKSGNAAVLTFVYGDGSEQAVYLRANEHLVGWWFPQLKKPDAGVAWRGPNPKSHDVGVSWAAVANPNPDKLIRSIRITAAADGAIYALVALTLADRPPYHAPELGSFGGPDNWSGGTTVLGLVQGLVGAGDGKPAFQTVRLSPRWASAGVDQAKAVVHYPKSDGYIAYDYRHDAPARRIDLRITGSGSSANLRVLLPATAEAPTNATINGQPADVRFERIEKSVYAIATVPLDAPADVRIEYR